LPRLQVPRGSIEQVIYTWARETLGGVKGLGFAQTSPTLRDHYAWLKSWPADRFEVVPSQADENAAFSGWRDAISHGAFAVDDYNVVYRKIPSVGTDDVGRPRFVVHALVGHRDEISLARVASTFSRWLTADRCPLNRLPQLESIDSRDLEERPLQHPEEEDAAARELLRMLAEEHGRLRLANQSPNGLDDLIRHVHLALPTALWPDVELTCFAGSTGFDVTVQIASSRPPIENANGNDAQLTRCQLHEAVETTWKRATGWPDFLSTFKTAPIRHRSDSISTSSAATAAPSTASPREILRSAVAAAAGTAQWSFDEPIDDRVARRLVQDESWSSAVDPWLRNATYVELRAVLANLSDSDSITPLAQFLADSASAESLALAWQHSAAPAVAIAALRHPDIQRLTDWSKPYLDAERHLDDIGKLAAYFAAVPTGTELLKSLFGAGVLRDRRWRRAFVSALLKTQLRREFIFDELLTSSGAGPSVYCEVALDHLDELSDWLRLPSAYRDAFRLGLDQPRWFARVFERFGR
jgi:hypothetical protein